MAKFQNADIPLSISCLNQKLQTAVQKLKHSMIYIKTKPLNSDGGAIFKNVLDAMKQRIIEYDLGKLF